MTARARDVAAAQAPTDWRRAATLAAAIPEPWSRAQALAWAARYAPAGDVVRLTQTAAEAGAEAPEAYRAVAVGAWPLRALAERGFLAEARTLLGTLLSASTRIVPPVSRLAALELLWDAAFPLGAEAREAVVAALGEAACAPQALHHWRATRVLVHVARTLHDTEAALGAALVRGLPPGPVQRRVVRALQTPPRAQPRAFFWTDRPTRDPVTT